MKEKIIGIIADSIGIKNSELDMKADLEDIYDMDSTEKADLARILEGEFKIRIVKSSKESWNTAEDIIKFVTSELE